MDDAHLLLASDRLRRAYALGVIAVEEAAKYMRCRHALETWSGALTVAQLNAILRPKGNAHVPRYLETLCYLAALAPNAWRRGTDFKKMAEMDMRARERALYVEVAQSGVSMTPSDVSEAEARQWVTGMVGFFGTLAGTWSAGLDDALEEARRQDGVPPKT